MSSQFFALRLDIAITWNRSFLRVGPEPQGTYYCSISKVGLGNF